MPLLAITPAAPLDAWIERIWDWDMPTAAFRLERVLPSAQAQLIINLEEAETRVYDSTGMCQRFDAVALDAPSTRSFVIDTHEQVRVIGIVFRAGAAARFFGERMDLLGDQHADLDALLKPQAQRLRAQLLEAADGAARIRLLQQWAMQIAAGLRPVPPSVRQALHTLERAPAVNRIAAIARDCGVSTRYLSDAFRAEVGMTPKRYARLRRFQQLVGDIHGRRRVDWAALAADGGFVDQAHLAHEFRAFSGMRPGDYLRLQGPHAAHVPIG